MVFIFRLMVFFMLWFFLNINFWNIDNGIELLFVWCVNVVRNIFCFNKGVCVNCIFLNNFILLVVVCVFRKILKYMMVLDVGCFIYCCVLWMVLLSDKCSFGLLVIIFFGYSLMLYLFNLLYI